MLSRRFPPPTAFALCLALLLPAPPAPRAQAARPPYNRLADNATTKKVGLIVVDMRARLPEISATISLT